MSAKWSDDTKFTPVSALDVIVGLTAGDNAKCTRSDFKASLSLAKGDVGLGNVDNTSDATKNAASVTLTHKTINGADNTLVIRVADVPDLSSLYDAAGAAAAVTSGTLAQFAATTSAQLAGVISDETGSGALVFATSPTLVTPNIGTPSAGTLTNCTGLPQSGVVGLTTSDAAAFKNVVIGHSTLTYASTTTIDFGGNGYRSETLTGDVIFASSNLAVGAAVTVRIIGDSSDRTLTAASGWKVSGLASPATLPSGKTGILTLTSFGTSDSDVCGAYVQLD